MHKTILSLLCYVILYTTFLATSDVNLLGIYSLYRICQAHFAATYLVVTWSLQRGTYVSTFTLVNWVSQEGLYMTSLCRFMVTVHLLSAQLPDRFSIFMVVGRRLNMNHELRDRAQF